MNYYIHIHFKPAMLIPDNLNIKTSCDSSFIQNSNFSSVILLILLLI